MTTIKTDLGDTEESGRRERFEPAGTIASTNVQTAIEETSGDVSALTSVVSALSSASVSFVNLGVTGGFLNWANPGTTSSLTVRNIGVSAGQLVITNASGTVGNPLIGLANSGATAGTYGTRNQNQVITIDAFGRITNAVTTNLYNVSVSAGELVITNLSITSSSQLVGLANSGVTAGKYGSSAGVPVLTLDRFGRINSAGTASLSGGSAATQAEMEAGTNTVAFASPQNINYAPGAAKAWVNFTGTGPYTINASHNVASVAHNGAGDYTVTLTTNFSSTQYAAIVSGGQGGLAGPVTAILQAPFGSAPTSTAFRFAFATPSTLATNDANFISAMFFGDQP